MGVSENSVPHCTQWLMIIIPIKWLFHWEYTLFSDIPIYRGWCHCPILGILDITKNSSHLVDHIPNGWVV